MESGTVFVLTKAISELIHSWKRVGICLGLTKAINEIIHSWNRVGICPRRGIETLVVYKQPSFLTNTIGAVHLLDEDSMALDFHFLELFLTLLGRREGYGRVPAELTVLCQFRLCPSWLLNMSPNS